MKAGIWCHAWDFCDGNLERTMGFAAESGLTHLSFAGSYHAGWFVHPHHARKTYFAPSGAVYFQPNFALYGDLQPLVAPICARTDWMREVGNHLDRFGLKMISWTVGAHNTRLGLLHPDATVTNCFGDSYPHALCIAEPRVRQYLVALCQDLSFNLPLEALQLESFAFEGWNHGHHHERDLTVLSPLEARLMGLCFHPATRQAARNRGVDAEKVRLEVAALLQSAFDEAPDRPENFPQNWEECCEKIADLNPYAETMREIERDLRRQIRAQIKDEVALHSFDGPNALESETFAAWSLFLYGQSAAQTRASFAQAQQSPAARDRELWGFFRLGMNSVKSQDELSELLGAARESGAAGVQLYNFSEAPRKTLGWIKEALQA